MSLKDNEYQKNFAQKKIDSLTSFLEDIQCRQGTNNPKKPKCFVENRSSKSLNRFLIEAEAEKEINQDTEIELGGDDSEAPDSQATPDETEDKVQASADEKEQASSDGKFFLGANQRYFMGAGNDPLLTIITQVGDDKIKYFQYPWKKEQVIKKDIGKELMKKGSETWLSKNAESTEEDLKRSIESVIAGKPGEKVTLEDYQFANVQIRYTGSEKGDEAPWQELEQKYNVNVGGVLANKQTYNVRLTNRSLHKLEDELRQAEPEERNFKIVKIMKEEEDFMIECGVYPMDMVAFGLNKPKPSIREVPAEDLESLKKQIEYGLRNNIVYGDYGIGETVNYDDGQWVIAEFIPWLKELCVLLVSIDNVMIADQVPVKKIRKLTPEELSGLRSLEDFVKGKKSIVLDFPQSGGDGVTKDIAKEAKAEKIVKVVAVVKCIKEKKNLKESLYEDKVEDLADFIDNDADTYKKDFAPAAKNLTSKWNDGSYNRDLSLTTFKQIAESAGKRFFISHDGSYEGQDFTDSKQMFPENIVTQVAKALRQSFENQAKAGMISEAIERICESGVKTKHNSPHPDSEAYDQTSEKSDQLTIGSLPEETGKNPALKGQTSTVKENIPFTENEKKALKEASSQVKMEIINNATTLSWDNASGLVKVTITKSPQPQQKNFVYSATSKLDNNLDKERTIDSKPFETEDDIDLLKELLSSLKLNEEEELNESEKKPLHPIKRIKYVNAFPIRNEKATKSEIIGNIQYQYKLVKDIKEKKPKMKGKSKSHGPHHPTKVKIVSSYPMRDGKPAKSETIGNITYRYKTKADKKKEADKRKALRKRKFHEESGVEVELMSADRNSAVIKIDGTEQRITWMKSFETPSGSWIFKEFIPADPKYDEEASIIIIKVNESPNGKTRIEDLVVGQPITL